MPRINSRESRGSGKGQESGRGQGRGRGRSNYQNTDGRRLYNHERDEIVRCWSHLSPTARTELLNLLGGMGGNPLTAAEPDGQVSDCRSVVVKSSIKNKDIAPAKAKYKNSWNRPILANLPGVADFGKSTSSERAEKPQILKLLSIASGCIARGKRNLSLSDKQITEGISSFHSSTGWDLPSLKGLYPNIVDANDEALNNDGNDAKDPEAAERPTTGMDIENQESGDNIGTVSALAELPSTGLVSIATDVVMETSELLPKDVRTSQETSPSGPKDYGVPGSWALSTDVESPKVATTKSEPVHMDKLRIGPVDKSSKSKKKSKKRKGGN